MRYAVIMAGGAGTRLWPMSRKDRPKQLIRFIERSADGKTRGTSQEPTSLLAVAGRRLEGLIALENRYICTAEAYRDLIHEELPGFKDSQILGEPCARDTVNAIGLAAAVLEKADPEAIFAVLTADHIIEPDETFRERMDAGFRLVEDDPRRLVTFSIAPTYPATGFGYIERGTPIRGVTGVAASEKIAYHVVKFIEKPDLPRAEAYVRSGEFAWNSGMFVWRASTFMEALKKYKPESHDGLREIQAAWGKKGAKGVLERVYPTLPKISVDYAIMEPAAKDALKASAKDPARDAKPKAGATRFSMCAVHMDVKWLDVGSWPSYALTLTPDKHANRAAGQGASVQLETKGVTAVNAEKGHTLALLGLHDVIVVHTKDATLVMARSHAEKLKALHAQLPDSLT